jgi:hypothetical protein
MRLIIRYIDDFERYTKITLLRLMQFLFFDCYAKWPFFLHSFRFGSEVHLDESSLTAGSVVFPSDLRSALEEFLIFIWERSFGRFFFYVFGTASTRGMVWSLGELGSRCYIPVLASNWGVLGQVMDQGWRLGLYEMRSALTKFYTRCKNDASSLAALRIFLIDQAGNVNCFLLSKTQLIFTSVPPRLTSSPIAKECDH